MPDRIKNTQVVRFRVYIFFMVPCAITIPHAKIRITTVLMAVAKFESTPAIPIFAKIEVAAANKAESAA